MIFGKIDYLNLLPFHVFLKRHVRNTRIQATIAYKKGVPSEVNKAFKKRKVNAAFISSVESARYKCTDLGIAAFKEVLSVLVIPGATASDSDSATSNALARLLHQEGQVIIGDKALKYYLTGNPSIDLAHLWHEKTGLPFVFARLCYHKKECQIKRLVADFKRHDQKIPYYLLLKASKKSGISQKDITMYLKKIHYELKTKEKKSLKRFLHEVKRPTL